MASRYSRGGNYHNHRAKKDQFYTLKGGAEFYFPRPWSIEADPTLVDKLKNHLKFLGGYSEDKDGNFCDDKSVLNFLNTGYLPDRFSKEKTVSLDLTVAEEKTEKYTGTTLKRLSNFCSWILSHKEMFLEFKEESGNGGKFVFAKSVISTILQIPFLFRSAFAFHAVCLDDIFYIMINREGSQQPIRNDHISNWAHKFEQYMTAGTNTQDGIIKNADHRCVLSSKLGPHKLIYSSSVDCFNPDLYEEDMTDLSACVFLKCSSETQRLKRNTQRYKMLSWCTELILTGAPECLVGYRNAGEVNLIKLYNAEDMILEGKDFWDVNVSFTFAEKFLSFVKKRTESKPGTAFYFEKPAIQTFVTSSEGPVDEFPPQWFSEGIKAADTTTTK